MIIPESFKMGAVEWNVSLLPHLVRDNMGLTETGPATISIDETNARSVVEQTFCHELVHVIMFSMGKRYETHDEEFVDAFGVFLHQYLEQHEQALVLREA